MSDWYSRALNRARPQQQAAPQARYVPPHGPPRWQDDRALSTPGPQQPSPQVLPDEMMPLPIQWAMKLTNAARSAVTNGVAHKTDREPCPQCGSPQFFSRATSKRMPPPAPHCYNCGYNDGMFEQGLESSWVGVQP